METAVQIIWWIGLVGALVATVVILKQVALILRVLGGIHQLATITRDASRATLDHIGGAAELAGVERPAGELRESARHLSATARSIAEKLDGPAPDESRQGT